MLAVLLENEGEALSGEECQFLKQINANKQK